jgi:hypothetical protein
LIAAAALRNLNGLRAFLISALTTVYASLAGVLLVLAHNTK